MTSDSDPEIYPMPMFAGLEVSDVARSAEWYEDVLGFANVFQMPTLAHLRYRKYADVLLVPSETEGERERRASGVTVSFTAEGETVAEIAERARDADADVSGPTETSYNTREVEITDPDGYALAFTEPVDTSRRFEDVMGVEYENR
ncbi:MULTISPECIES: VOC family protein [Halorussus]|uniref:VOC family protein n=1 Tax=Halorussus TaxID=1070314 RepID=UPI00209D658B|nr:VOC family protein [Halorussus vallis]USZ76077.1 VOC family protein [Halorussus vallis]